jgi:ubiquinone/menaquinone biosynthesis C-methylase UbiE
MANTEGNIGNVSPNTELLRMAMAYSRSAVLAAAARLGVADALGDEEHSIGELAETCEADSDSLRRLLRALCVLGVTEETRPHHFRLTEFGKPLRKDTPQSAWPHIIFWADLLADSWSFLTDCVRTGQNAARVRPSNVPSRWSQVPEAHDIFRAVMGTAPAEDYAPIAVAWDFSKAKVVADLGGGGGALLTAVLKRFPHLHGMLIDFEDSIENARPRLHEEKLSNRCELIAADLLQSVPGLADVYMMKHVLHGRSDAEATTMLRNCRAVIPEDGTLLIIEFLLPATVSSKDAHLEGKFMSDLNMMVVTGGKERSEPEFRSLVESAGFLLTHVYTVADGMGVSIVEAKPVESGFQAFETRQPKV